MLDFKANKIIFSNEAHVFCGSKTSGLWNSRYIQTIAVSRPFILDGYASEYLGEGGASTPNYESSSELFLYHLMTEIARRRETLLVILLAVVSMGKPVWLLFVSDPVLVTTATRSIHV